MSASVEDSRKCQPLATKGYTLAAHWSSFEMLIVDTKGTNTKNTLFLCHHFFATEIIFFTLSSFFTSFLHLPTYFGVKTVVLIIPIQTIASKIISLSFCYLASICCNKSQLIWVFSNPFLTLI